MTFPRVFVIQTPRGIVLHPLGRFKIFLGCFKIFFKVMENNSEKMGERVWCMLFVLLLVFNVILWVILSAAWC